MIWLIVGSLAPSFLVAWSLCFLIRRRSTAWGLVDEPGERKVHRVPTPTGGGLAIWAGIVLPLAVGQVILWSWSELDVADASPGRAATGVLGQLAEFVRPYVPGLLEKSRWLWGLLAVGTGLVVLGLIDDLRGLDWQLRLAVQTAAALVVVFGFGWRLTLFIDMPVLTGLLTVVWIVGITNSFNMLDNMDGLSGGVAAIAASFLAAVLLLTREPGTLAPQLFVAGLLLVLVGSLAGFLWHNRPPAKLFMGDAGSYVVGFYLGVATVLATFAGGSSPRHAILIPLCVLAIPLYDTASVIWIRIRAGRSIFAGDKSHFSHRLVELGFTSRQAVLTIYLAELICGAAALLLVQVRTSGAVIVMLQIVCVLALVGILESIAGRGNKR